MESWSVSGKEDFSSDPSSSTTVTFRCSEHSSSAQTVLPTVSPPPLSDGAAVCGVSVLTTDVSPSDFGVELIPVATAVMTPPLLVVDC